MSLRALLVTVLLSILITTSAVVVLSFLFLQEQLFTVFPSELVSQASNSLFVLFTWQGLGIILLTASMMLGLYVLLERLLVSRIRALLKAMTVFAESGERIVLSNTSSTPKEIWELVDVFDKIVEKVEASHKKDLEVSRVKSDFISTAAHQLRTPLTGIRWALEALEKSDLSDELKSLVQNAKDKSHELVSIVGTLLDISAIESGKYKYVFTALDVESVAEEVAKDFSPMAQKALISVYVERGTSNLPKVRADKERIKWILNNLVENAIRYTPEKGSVRIHGEVHGSKLLFMVRDTGIGIGKQDKNNIFERFYRAQNAIAVQTGGNGLGLYIARTVATDHGGDLTFAPNEDGIGTTFTLSLPIAVP